MDLRTVFCNQLGIDIPEQLVSTDKLTNAWTRAISYWNRYHTVSVYLTQGIIVDTSGVYTFTDTIPSDIVKIIDLSTGCTVSASNYNYAPPVLVIDEGEYSISTEIDYTDVDSIDETDLNDKLLELYVTYCTIQLGQFLKFSKFAEMPFEIDNEIFAEAKSDKKELEEWIQINRDEDLDEIEEEQADEYSLYY